MRLGLWSLELFQTPDKILTDPTHRAHYENIFLQLLKIGINILNTDRPKVGR